MLARPARSDMAGVRWTGSCGMGTFGGRGGHLTVPLAKGTPEPRYRYNTHIIRSKSQQLTHKFSSYKFQNWHTGNQWHP